MEEDLGVKAPVTRLRRRLSIEAEESTSAPTTPGGTPTKKRAARLAAKPQLELINELVTEDVPKKSTRKAAAKEAVEGEASTPVTPSRRSTRVRSNTSLLVEPTLTVDSPRARRALRRNSQLGSDTESSVTPVRQTRRPRKDSTTSVDKQAETEKEKVVMYLVTTTTEGESNKTESEKDPENLKAEHKSPVPKRKSPRLNKKGTKTDASNKDKDEKEVNTLNENKQSPDINTEPTMVPNESEKTEDKGDNFSKINVTKEDKLSLTSVVLLDRGKTINKKINAMNKSTSALEKIADNLKNKRTRTKSWTTITSPAANVAFHSDNESGKVKTKQNSLNNSIGSGDGILGNGGKESKPEPKTVPEIDMRSPNRSLNKSKSASLLSVENKENIVVANSQFEVFESEINKSDTEKILEKSPGINMKPMVVIEDSDSCSVGKLSIDIQIEGEDQCVPTMLNPSTPTIVNQSVEPMDIDETMPTNVTINDFEKSNTSNEESEVPQNDIKLVSREERLSKDESFNKSNRKSSVSYQSAVDSERLSVDEDKKNNKTNEVDKSKSSSMFVQEKNNDTPKSNRSSFSFQNAEEKEQNESVKTVENPSRKSSISVGEITVENISDNSGKSQKKSFMSQSHSEIPQNSFDDEKNYSKSSNKSKRKASISHMDSQNLEKSSNENKSTLVISELKDVSSNDVNKAMSPNTTNNELSKSMNNPVPRNKEINNDNLSLNYLTSTPIQQKSIQKLNMQINTSIISPNVGNKKETPKKNSSEMRSDSDSSDEETNEKIKVENKKENVVAPNKKTTDPAASSSDSSDNESEITSNNPKKNTTKQSPIKKATFPESSDSSDEESMPNNKSNNKKTPQTALNSSKSKQVKTEAKGKKASQPHSNSESSNDSYEGIMKDLSKMVDDEASEASDDYESGDSQNDEERRYEAENEIVEKGETLDSEEEFSNDSEYEKDSFIVSSDAEDHEMLSGTGDDLTDTDNELTMSKKSKKKFNERKQKQQKKASKEMYEARHKINESANSAKSETIKSKKPKRQRLESSNIESDDHDNEQPKKKNRLRIDSSQDNISKSDADDSIDIKKKKSKRLSESVCEIVNEKEITICNQSIAEKNDPLSVAIKQEPKTPQKHFNMSTVAINDNIEEVQVDSNASMMGQNEAVDPLQATMVQEDDSSSSGNMEIIQNYDSVLNNLSKQTNKIKTNDTSLNLNKKSKDAKVPLIDQLNLTVTQNKKSKKNKKRTEKQPETNVKESSNVVSNEDEDTSDSINMKLLFSEDSNDSEIPASQFKPETQEPKDNFIPLKRTAAQTNIPGNMDLEKPLNESHAELNVSKKKKNRKSSNCVPKDNVPKPENAFKLIIDTTGTHEDTDTSSTLVKSAKKKKNKNKSINEENESVIETPEDSNIKFFVDTTGTYEDVGNSSTLINSAKKKNNKVNSEESTDIVSVEDSNLEVSRHSNSAKKKKNKKDKESKLDVVENPEESGFQVIMDTSTQINSTKKKDKEKLNMSQASESAVEIDCTDGAQPLEVSLAGEKKRKKNKSFNVSANNIESSVTEIHSEKKKSRKKSESALDVEAPIENADTTIAEELPVNVSGKSDKKKKKNKNVSFNIEPEEVENLETNTKDNLMSADDIATPAQNIVSEEMPTESIKKKKKNKHQLDVSAANNAEEDSDEAPMETSYKSEKKTDSTDNVADDALPGSSEKKKHKKNKKKKNKNLSQSLTSDTDKSLVTNENGEGDKRKRKLETTDSLTEDAAPVVPKKRKILDDEYVVSYTDSNKGIDEDNEENNTKKSKKHKKSKQQENNSQDEVTQLKSKKRKREETDEELSSKLVKQNSFDSVHAVARLPESLLNQLDDKPKKRNANKKRTAAISTVPFVVEDAQRRKNKPSQYLEQSVYLNDSPAKDKQKKPKHNKPKVLPFTPTALTSVDGYTSFFNINVLPKEAQFVAQASNVHSFKATHLGKSQVKKLGTLERCKLQRSHKISKF